MKQRIQRSWWFGLCLQILKWCPFPCSWTEGDEVSAHEILTQVRGHIYEKICFIDIILIQKMDIYWEMSNFPSRVASKYEIWSYKTNELIQKKCLDGHCRNYFFYCRWLWRASDFLIVADYSWNINSYTHEIVQYNSHSVIKFIF